jgi:SMI1 / KNR4 family (SUKH-1)
MSRESGGWQIDAGFVAAFQMQWRAPAADGELSSIEAMLGVALPPLVRDWYRAADGGVARAPGSELTLHTLAEVRAWFEQSPLAERAQFPFASNNDSNPFCVCCNGPLLGYVVQMPHDDEPRLVFRAPAGFFHAAAAQLASEQQFEPHDLPSDFDDPERTDRDVEAGRALVQQTLASPMQEQAETSATLMFAADLLRDAVEIRAIAELGDEYVWQHVARRLQRLATPEAERELNAMHQVFDDFVETCAAQLRAVGFDVSVHAPYGRKGLQINPYELGLNMEMFFARRLRPDCHQFMLERVRALTAKHESPG